MCLVNCSIGIEPIGLIMTSIYKIYKKYEIGLTLLSSPNSINYEQYRSKCFVLYYFFPHISSILYQIILKIDYMFKQIIN